MSRAAAGRPAEPVIRLAKVERHYRLGGEMVQALAGIDLSFAAGSFWAIMGPSGSGKSTMLNLLGCLDRPSAGHYYLLGQEIGRLDDDQLSELRLRQLGFIFQSFNLIPQLTVRENIELPLYYLDRDEASSRKRAMELAEMVGLGSRLHHRPMELSGGQQQRVAVARALANDPAILLADEPTGNLDSATSVQIMELLGELNRQGKTIIMVTHEEDIAAYAGNRLHMRDGRVERVTGLL
jgi:putative ABC transport system ATP-binding protein